jgi:hypothetical protein
MKFSMLGDAVRELYKHKEKHKNFKLRNIHQIINNPCTDIANKQNDLPKAQLKKIILYFYSHRK